MSLRTPLGRVRGLGSAKEGTHHFWIQRLTAVALIPLTLWGVVTMLTHAGGSYAEVVQWLRSPVVTVCFLLLIVMLFYHALLGVQVVIEDYVHLEWVKIGTLVLTKFLIILLAALSLFAVLRISIGS